MWTGLGSNATTSYPRRGFTGMQGPPAPSPGVKGMNPYGLVAHALTISCGSMPCAWHASAISLAYAMLTSRKQFSNSLLISAVSMKNPKTSMTSTAAEPGMVKCVADGAFSAMFFARPGFLILP